MNALQPLGDRVIVQPLEEDGVSAGGVIIPDSVQEKPQRGVIVASGPGPRARDGSSSPMGLDPGDEVFYSKYGGTEISLDVGDLLILRESDILAKVVA